LYEMSYNSRSSHLISVDWLPIHDGLPTHKEMIMERFQGILIGSVTALLLAACSATGTGGGDMGGSSARGSTSAGSTGSGMTNGAMDGTDSGSPGTTGASGQGAGATSTTPPTTPAAPPAGQR
jgi:hypothetical protein